MSAGETSRELTSLLKSLRSGHDPAALATAAMAPVVFGGTAVEPVLSQFIRSFLIWESTTTKAAQAQKKLEAAVVDVNELRMYMPDEFVKIIGERYPRAAERALRLRTALNVIYSREHAVTLERLNGQSKKDARDYFDRIDGVPGFVAARVSLLALSHHAAPMDSRIRRRLVEAKVVGSDLDEHDAAHALEKKTRGGELIEAYVLIQAGADEASYAAADSHLSDLKPVHKPVDRKVREEHEAARRAARKKLKASRVGKKKDVKAKTSASTSSKIKKRPSR